MVKTSFKGKYRYIGNKLAHIVLAEKALGKKLPKGAKIHHVDGNGLNNAPSNLVICPSQVYHNILHRRAEAYEATGMATWVKCGICKTWDDPINLFVKVYQQKITKRHIAYHPWCAKKKNNARYARIGK